MLSFADGNALSTEFHCGSALFFLSTALGHLRCIDFVDTHLRLKFNFSPQITLANFNSKLFLCGIVTKVNETLRA